MVTIAEMIRPTDINTKNIIADKTFAELVRQAPQDSNRPHPINQAQSHKTKAADTVNEPAYTVCSSTLNIEPSSQSHADISAAVGPGLEDEADGSVRLINCNHVGVLTAYLLDKRRRLPVLVASRRPVLDCCMFDTAKLAADLVGVATVFELLDSYTSLAFADALSKKYQVYGGMVRLYPAGFDWLVDSTLLKGPYHAKTSEQRLHWGSQIVHEAFAMMAQGQAKSIEVPGKRSERRIFHEATVTGTLSDRCIARLDNGTVVSVAAPKKASGINVDRLFEKGQRICGNVNPETNVMTGIKIRPRNEALADYRAGMTVLARVEKADQDECSMMLYPGVVVKVSAEDMPGVFSSQSESLRCSSAVGTALPMLIRFRGKGWTQWDMCFSDADIDSVSPAPALLDGGPEWLQKKDVDESVFAQNKSAEASGKKVGSPTADSIGFANGISDESSAAALASQLSAEKSKNEKLNEKYERKCRQFASLQEYAAQQRNLRLQQNPQFHTMRGAFKEDSQRLRYEAIRFDAWIRETWSLRFSAEDKPRYPLPETWDYDPGFFDSLEGTAINRQEVIDACIDVLTGLVEQSKSRGLHPFRESSGPLSPARRGPNGEKMFRINLGQGVSARRMHYGKGKEGRIIFVFVGEHDEGLW
ncbi:hypothetical protein OZX67_02125 [Bifidobacterium sp. ESL0728]|uniref:hypothetical protein n=1 Tax=Bifidobacterium sp. ESL0728 TaxID=2983220 RepID=UPI0023F9E42A|nr:hypothetical protein [Bifidobacterium sp. ESL0728]WEV59382.1 hypothetical protein OZX67_02125 [Bifidobacterium sp. ESL0728]